MPVIGPRHVLAIAVALVGGTALAQESSYEI